MSTTASATTGGRRELYLDASPTAVAAWCLDHLTDDAIYVAPSAAARRRVLDAIANHRVALGLRVVWRGNLLGLLEQRAGLAPLRLMPPALERLLLTICATEARMPLFGDSETPPSGAVDAMSRLVRSLRANGISPDAYQDAGGDPRAADAYRRFEGRRTTLAFADDRDRLDRVVASGIPSTPLIIEEPSIPDAATLQLLRAVAERASACHAGAVEFSAAGIPGTIGTYFRALGFEVSRGAGAVAHPPIDVVGAAGTFDETEFVARRILALLRAPDAAKPDDILGVVPGSHYLDLLHDALARLGVPVASPRRVPVLDVPLVRTLLDLLRVLADPEEDTPERGIELLSSVYLGLRLARRDHLAHTLVRRGAGKVRSWAEHVKEETNGIFVELARSIGALERSLQGPRYPRDLTKVVSRLALDFRFISSGRRANLSTGRDDLVRLDQLGWNELAGAMAELEDALRTAGVTKVSATEWLAGLDDLLADVHVRVEPKAVNGVQLTVAGAGLPTAKHVFALGWREGLMPRRVREPPLLTDRVKRVLNETGALFPLTTDVAERDRERKERVLCSARESLVITWPATDDDGEPMLRSRYLDELGIEDREVRAVGDPTWPLTIAATRAERMTRAAVLARHRKAKKLPGDELPLVHSTFGAVTAFERDTWNGERSAGHRATLGPAELEELAPLAGVMSASQSKSLAHCTFKHFVEKRLSLDAIATPEVDKLRQGSASHRILARIGREGFNPSLLERIFDEEWAREIANGLASDPAASFHRRVLLSQLQDLVAREAARECEARPAYFELAFGLTEDPEKTATPRDPASHDEGIELALPEDSPIASTSLRGSIDRVDVLERGGGRYGIAIDYKSGRGAHNYQEAKELADFQLPIYCFALPAFGIEPVGAMYLGVASGDRYGVVIREFAAAFGLEDENEVKKLSKAEFDVFMRERLDALAEHVATLARGEIVVEPRNDDCGFCDLRPVCRIGTFGVGVIEEDV